VLVGRQSERARLRALVDAARTGTSFALLVHGDAGIGKTALTRAVAEQAEEDGTRVVRVRAFEGEAEIPWAGLSSIAAPFLEHLDRLPGVQAGALRRALALGDPADEDEPAAPDRFTVPVALLGLLGSAAEAAPLLVLVDDLQWLDVASRDALLFVARRLGNEGIGLLMTARDGEGFDPRTTRMPALRLEGLGDDDARSLLGAGVAPEVVDALTEAAIGNPLALTELLAALTPEQRAGDEPLPTPLPAGARVEGLFARRIADLPASTQRAVGVAAAMVRQRADVLHTALGELGIDPADVEPAEREGVLALEGGTVAFRHPLVRAAAYAAMAPQDRRETHRVLAAVAPDRRLRAWHLSTAAVGPDAATAGALEEAALDARTVGAPVEAQRTWWRAAQLSPDPVDARRRRLEAARDALAAGDTQRAFEALDALVGDPATEPPVRAEARRLAGVARTRRGALREGVAMLEQEADALAADAPVAAAETLLLSLGGRFGTGDMEDVVRTTRRVRELAGDHPRIRARADVAEGEALVPLGRTAEALALIDAGSDALDLRADDLTLVAMVGISLMWTERHEDARAWFDDLIVEGRATGALTRLIFPLAGRGDLERRRGRWPAAAADAEEAVRLGRDSGFSAHMAYALAVNARIAGPSGRFDDARRDAGEARALTTPSGGGSLLLHALASLGLTELSAGRPAAAVLPLREAFERYRALGWAHPTTVEFHGDLVEALVESGERLDAEEVLDAFAAEAEHAGTRWPAPLVARGHGLLEPDPEAAVAHLGHALELHEEVPDPFERARTLLLLGDRLRRAERRDEGREVLRQALEAFELLGARPWIDRTRRAMTRSGVRADEDGAARDGAGPLPDLTSQEQRIVQLVTAGMTNREVAGALFLSPKTIEHILTGIYKKAGVRSRTQLAKKMAS
jgi:DNA-binding CsgD family transcriptional regulator/tetratricopeptide (TPR) repeat protein